MLIGYKRGQTSIIIRVKILDSSATTGGGKTGLTNSSSGLIISTIADNESTATVYTAAGSTIQTIATLGTYAAPSASNCRFKEVDSTNHKGLYEIQLDNARYAVSNAKSLIVSVLGATNAAETDVVIPLTDFDFYDSVRGNLSALPNTSCTTNASLLTSGTGTDQISVSSGKLLLQATQTGVTIPTVTTLTNLPSVPTDWLTAAGVKADAVTKIQSGLSTYSGGDTSGVTTLLTRIGGNLTISGGKVAATLASTDVTGNISADIQTIKGQTVSCATGVTIPALVASTTNITAATGIVLSGVTHTGAVIPTVTTTTTTTNLTNAPTSGDFTAAMKTSLNAATPTVTVGTITDKTGYSLTQAFPSNFASLGISAGGHISNVDTLTTYTGNTPQTGDSYARIGIAGVGLTNIGDTRVAHLDADITSRMATYTQPTGFLAAVFPSGTLANTTNITGGIITTATNLTNLPTAPTDWVSAASVSAAAVTKIQSGLSTYSGGDSSGTTTLLGRLTSTRAGYLDNLNGVGTSSNQTSILNAVNSITTNTARSAPRVPFWIIRPSSSTTSVTGDLYLYTLQGALEDADTNTVTVHARNASGTSYDSKLSSTTMTRISAGKYRLTYTVSSTDPQEDIYFDFTWTVGSVSMADGAVSTVADVEVVNTINTINSNVSAIKSKTDNLPSSPAAVGSAMTLSGDFTSTMKTSLGTAIGTAQTGDSYPIISSGTYGNSALHTQISAMSAGTNLSNLSTASSVSTLQTTANTINTNVSALGSPMQSGSTVTLATSQPNYAPSKAGDKMDLINSPNSTAITAIQSGLSIPTASANAAAVRTNLSTELGRIDANISSVTSAALDLLTTALEEDYAEVGVNASVAQLLYEIRQSITAFAISGKNKNVKKMDGTTAATYQLNSNVYPTSITRVS